MFDKCMETVFAHEGGYANDPNDPGGETKYGISKRSYPELNIRELTREHAKEIYREDFWYPLRLYMLDNANICLEIFDFGVNSGPETSVKLAQKLAGTIEDGILGGITARAINEFEGDFVKTFKHARIIFYESLVKNNSKFNIFLKGRINRVNQNYFINV